VTPASPEDLRRRIDVALGREPADLVIRGGRFLDVARGELVAGDVAVHLAPTTAATFHVPAAGPGGLVIGVVPGSLLTERLTLDLPYAEGRRRPDAGRDVATVCVLGRHGRDPSVGRGFGRGFGLRRGALASSVGHDSHNVIAVGASEADMAVAVNRLIELEGGFVAVADGRVAAADGRVLAEIAQPIAGLMSDRPCEDVARDLAALREAAAALGCRLEDPFVQLAFLPLPVIPHLKITDRGLVDVDRFELVA